MLAKVNCIDCYNHIKSAKRTFICCIDGKKIGTKGLQNIDCSFFYSPSDALIGIDEGFMRKEWMKHSI